MWLSPRKTSKKSYDSLHFNFWLRSCSSCCCYWKLTIEKKKSAQKRHRVLRGIATSSRTTWDARTTTSFPILPFHVPLIFLRSPLLPALPFFLRLSGDWVGRQPSFFFFLSFGLPVPSHPANSLHLSSLFCSSSSSRFLPPPPQSVGGDWERKTPSSIASVFIGVTHRQKTRGAYLMFSCKRITFASLTIFNCIWQWMEVGPRGRLGQNARPRLRVSSRAVVAFRKGRDFAIIPRLLTVAALVRAPMFKRATVLPSAQVCNSILY